MQLTGVGAIYQTIKKGYKCDFKPGKVLSGTLLI